MSNDAVMRVPVTFPPTLELGIPMKVFDGPYLFAPRGGGLGRMYDVSPDGQRFLVIKEGKATDESPAARIILVQNWFEELKARVPAK